MKITRHPMLQDDLFEGDIELDDSDGFGDIVGAGIGSPRVWTHGIVPYLIDESITTPNRVNNAIDNWREGTEIIFAERTDERNYVVFVDGPGCSSKVGMFGGKQTIKIHRSCGTEAVTHEIGHTLGLNHEHTRGDRDELIVVHWDNIDPSHRNNFQMSGLQMYGELDFFSIMMYWSTAWAIDVNEPAMTRVSDGGIWGKNMRLSDGDKATIAEMYAEEIADRPEAPPEIEPGAPHILEVHGWEIRVWLRDPAKDEEILATVETKSTDSGVFAVSWSGWAIMVTVLPYVGGWWTGASGTTDVEWRLEGIGPSGEGWRIDKQGREPSSAFIKILPSSSEP